MKLSIALAALVVAFTGSVAAVPTPGDSLIKRGYPNCNSNSNLQPLNLPKGYAIIPTTDNNAANVPGIQQGKSIAECIAQCASSTEGCSTTVFSNSGYCYPKNDMWDAININTNINSVIAIRNSDCQTLVDHNKISATVTGCCNT